MKKLICFLLLFISPLLFAKGGDEVRNGGGLAEQYLAYTLNNMPRIIDRCLADQGCKPDPKAREVLFKIKETIENEIAANILKFSSSANKPGFFVVDGVVRMAVTGNSVGSPIYYNLDLLYQSGEVQMSYGQAIQSLIHELGHHHDIQNHDMLERLGAEVRRSTEGRVTEVPFFPHMSGNGFSALGTFDRSFNMSGSILFLSRVGIVNLQHHFSSLLESCEKPKLEGVTPGATSAVQFFNLRWKYSVDSYLSEDKILTGNVFLYCSINSSKKYRKLYEFALKIKVDLIANRFIYRSSELVENPRYILTNEASVSIE